MSSRQGKVALVTGGGSGIGRATAVAFARQSVNVVVAGRRRAEGEHTVHLVRAAGADGLFMQTDVAQGSEVKALIEQIDAHYGRLDYAFNNAGVSGRSSVIETSEEEFDRITGFNLKGAWLCLKYELPLMLRQGHGSIVFTGSVLAEVGMSGMSAYCGSKGGVMALARAAAIEYATSGIRINVVNFAIVLTEMTEKPFGGAENLEKMLGPAHPIGRVGRPEEIANLAVWLCSDEASFITGQAVRADGGYASQ